jgi:AraC family transcriptional regulator, transcriptional activator of pobA
MKNVTVPFNWRTDLDDLAKADSIDNDFILLDSPIITSAHNFPFKVDVTTGIICIKGTTRGKINLKPYTTTSPGFIIILPDQILEYEYISEDFSGLFVIMSKKFTNSLNFEEKLPLFLSIRDKPFLPMSKEEIEALVVYYSILKRTVKNKDNPYRMEVVKHLIKAFFFSTGYQYHKLTENDKKSKNEMLVESFLNHVQANYKEQRGVEFYANKLYLTPKYLSKVIKENSGMSANDWIDSYVILEAKALLKSSNKTVQQISDELNFPSQSFFGKYFKRHVGVSPKDYKKA